MSHVDVKKKTFHMSVKFIFIFIFILIFLNITRRIYEAAKCHVTVFLPPMLHVIKPHMSTLGFKVHATWNYVVLSI